MGGVRKAFYVGGGRPAFNAPTGGGWTNPSGNTLPFSSERLGYLSKFAVRAWCTVRTAGYCRCSGQPRALAPRLADAGVNPVIDPLSNIVPELGRRLSIQGLRD